MGTDFSMYSFSLTPQPVLTDWRKIPKHTSICMLSAWHRDECLAPDTFHANEDIYKNDWLGMLKSKDVDVLVVGTQILPATINHCNSFVWKTIRKTSNLINILRIPFGCLRLWIELPKPHWSTIASIWSIVTVGRFQIGPTYLFRGE